MLQGRKVLGSVAAGLIAVLSATAAIGEGVVHLYNWNDYFAPDTLDGFKERTGIRPVLDVYDANEILEAKLLAGRSGYDLVFPTARPFAARHIKAGIYRELDRDKLPGWENLDPAILKSLEDVDPGNRYLVPYMWGTSGIGLNSAKVTAALGEEPENTWGLIFDPAKAEKLAACGIALLDDATEVYAAALAYLGKDPNSLAAEDLEAAQALLQKVHPFVRYFHSSQYISDLANGDICVALGYSGDVLQAQSNAEEAGRGVEVGYLIPREGAVLWTDVMAIPKDAPNPEAAHTFIAYLLDPQVIAAVSNHVYYANPNQASEAHLDEALREDGSIYPADEVRARLVVTPQRSDAEIRNLNRLWTRLKANR
ncbi:MAG: polyamine ABC transporter substrate-binding protein [Chromatiaceae bacterium]|jgi:putrescine transport system substrate-binding protein|nr:polyamine ABC transporter substrate-binding protein [Chromatiaceae bacterium]